MSMATFTEDHPKATVVILLGFVVWVAVILVQAAQGKLHASNTGPDPRDFSTCAQLGAQPGTDYYHAQCVDENGKVVNYRDSKQGRIVGKIAGQ
jgi:hypothetical protein